MFNSRNYRLAFSMLKALVQAISCTFKYCTIVMLLDSYIFNLKLGHPDINELWCS